MDAVGACPGGPAVISVLSVCVCMYFYVYDCVARYPPGHGDLYNALWSSGVLDSLLHDGKVGRKTARLTLDVPTVLV